MKKDTAPTLLHSEEASNSGSSNRNQGRIIEDYGVFKIVDGDHGFFLALGRHRISDIYKSKEEILDLINHLSPERWELLTTIILTLIDEVNKFNENLKSNNHG